MRTMVKNAWRVWKRLAVKIAHTQGHLLLGLIYLLILAPTALLLRLLHQDPLRTRFMTRSTYWFSRDKISSIDIFMKRQF